MKEGSEVDRMLDRKRDASIVQLQHLVFFLFLSLPDSERSMSFWVH